MSYDVGTIKLLKCEGAKILAEDAERLAGDRRRPECCFLEEVLKPRRLPDDDGFLFIDPKRFWWSGEGSGHSWDFFLREVAPKIHGTLEAIVTWEDGDSHSGLRIRDGVVTEPDVVMTLKEEP